ncbi:MAG: DUF2442 domain-containing protein [Verrucomicrobiae bacterium]|nr:DUF2442 domain-containing protein [Verrucomicrobiae bacterium]
MAVVADEMKNQCQRFCESGVTGSAFSAPMLNEPPHVHVSTGGNQAKFWLELAQLARNAGFSRGELSEIFELVHEHQQELLSSENECGSRLGEEQRGAYASGVWFSASRRRLSGPPFFVPPIWRSTGARPFGRDARTDTPEAYAPHVNPVFRVESNGMNTLHGTRVVRVSSTTDTLKVDFDDGRSVELPLIWFPRLFRATQAQRDNYELLGNGFSVHWPELDEDLSAKGLALGKPSIEFVKKQRKRQVAA